MEAVAEGLWDLAEKHEESGNIGPAIKCLEAICQSQVSFLPIIEVKTRLRIATLLLSYTDNVTHAKIHLERAVSTYFPIPGPFKFLSNILCNYYKNPIRLIYTCIILQLPRITRVKF